MEKVHPWCGQTSDLGRLKNRTKLNRRKENVRTGIFTIKFDKWPIQVVSIFQLMGGRGGGLWPPNPSQGFAPGPNNRWIPYHFSYPLMWCITFRNAPACKTGHCSPIQYSWQWWLCNESAKWASYHTIEDAQGVPYLFANRRPR